MLSRVVPEMSDVITLFSPQSKLISVDFPAFGFPTIATLIESSTIFSFSKIFLSKYVLISATTSLTPTLCAALIQKNFYIPNL